MNGYYADTNLADVLVMGNGYTDAQEQAVADIDSITATERRTILKATVKGSSHGSFTNAPELSLRFVEKGEISACHLAEGDTFDYPVELTAGTVVLSFVIAFGLSVFMSLLFSKMIRRPNMVESLKTME